MLYSRLVWHNTLVGLGGADLVVHQVGTGLLGPVGTVEVLLKAAVEDLSADGAERHRTWLVVAMSRQRLSV